ncbi:MAG: hypothetical protein IJ385_01785 [Ruminiclostridium sp.]|nr:hypothetical protein [Ruminiclostridium sp.]
MSIIEELFVGNIRPAEKPCISDNYSKAQSKQGEYFDRLEKMLSKKERHIIEKLWECTSEMEHEFGFEMFKTGLALGVQLTAECFKKDRF